MAVNYLGLSGFLTLFFTLGSILIFGPSFDNAWAANTAPTVDAGSDATIDEGGTFSSSGSFTDPDADTWIATIDYGDGTGSQPLTLNPDKTFALNHLYPQDNIFVNGRDAFDVPIPFTVTVTVNDGTEDTITTVFVTVENILPTVSPLADVTLNEGETLMVSGSFTDPGDEPQFEGHVDYGNVVDPLDDHLPLNPDNTFDLVQLYDQDGMFTVLVEIGDRSDFGITPEEFIVTVNNVAPTLTLGSDVTINEGEMFTSSGSFSDPGVDTWTITVDYDDGSLPVEIAFDDTMSFDLDHIYQNNGVFTVSVTVDDGDGGSDTKTLTVTVDNVAPTIDAGSDATIDEGDTFVSMGSFLDVAGDSPTLTADYGDGSATETLTTNPDNTFALNHIYSNDGIFTVTVTADDGDDSSFDTAEVIVNNVAPSISVSDQLVDENRDFTATGSFTDPGADSWSVTVDYGDGTGTSPPLTLNPDNSFSLAHNYLANGAYSVTVTVNDDDTFGVSSFTVGVFVSAGGPGTGLTSPPAVTTTLNGGATFSTSDQDIWGPVTSGSGTSSWELFNPQTWNERDGDSDFVTLAGKKLGGGIDAGTKGHLKLTASASKLTGEIGVDYPGNVAINYLDANTFLAGENVPISGSWNLNTVGAKIIAEKTMGDLRLDLDLGVDEFVDSQVCLLVGCFDPFVIPDISFDMHPSNTKLFSFTQAGGLDIPPALTGFAGFTGNFNPIMVKPPTTSVSSTTGTIIAEKTTAFSDINIDIDKVATRLGVAPPLEKSLTASGTGLTYNLFDADANVDFKAHQKLTFDTSVLIKLDFDTPVDGVTGGIVDVTTNGAGKITSLTYRDGDQINVIFPQGEINPITVTPTIFLDSSNTKLHQFTEVITVSDVEMESLSTTISVPGFTVIKSFTFTNPFPHLKNWECHKVLCFGGHYHHVHRHKVTTPGVEFGGISSGIGPIWTSGPQGVETKKDIISNKAFTLWGFNTVQLASFELDPEVPPTALIGGPYVVNEGSTIMLDASNSFDVDIPEQELTYRWDLDNDGIFETDGIVVEFVNTADGPATHLVSLQVCDYLNCDSDSGMVDVTNVDPTDDAGSDQEYVIHDTTSLDPAEYSDPGFDCDVCSTLEDFTATVNWGEGDDEPLLVTETPGSLGVLTQGTASGSHIYRLPGTYTVTVTVDDDDNGSTSDTLVNTILGAQDLKNRAISFLSPFENESHRVVKSIEHINKSLEEDLWVDEVYLEAKHGHRVYSEEHNAVQQLQQLLNQTPDEGEIPPPPSPELKEAAEDAIDLLVNSDRVLTITLMLDSSAATADKQNAQNKIDKENETAENEFSQGDASRDAGDFDNAIQHYRKAWDHAGLALKAAS